MIKTRAGFCVLMVCLDAFSLPLLAHHSVSLFDTSTPIIVKGIIADVHFANPHSAIFVEEVNAEGQPVLWAIENSGTLELTRVRGFNENNLQAGDPITVCGYAPKRSRPNTPNSTSRPVPPWWGKADRAITGRLLILTTGAAEHWSHYGPLDACQRSLSVQAQE